MQVYDIAIIGGGINGAGIARDAAMRGLSVALFEAQDFGAGTSSASSKLIHGGIRYLEQGHFTLVKQALEERDYLLSIACSIIQPLSFFMPDCPRLRSPWLVRIGLLLYDFLFRSRFLSRSKRYKIEESNGLRSEYSQGFLYQDARVDDARLVILNVLQAHQQGAWVANYHEVIRAEPCLEGWVLVVQDRYGKVHTVKAKILVNASGPAVNQVLEEVVGLTGMQDITWVKGSHIVLKQFTSSPHAFILQNNDQRVVFVIPWGDQLSLVGTTEQPYEGDLRQVKVSAEERTYLIAAVNQFFSKQISLQDIQFEFAGVRPLLGAQSANVSSQSREYRVEVQKAGPSYLSKVLSVYGGKLTTYRALSEKVVDRVIKELGVQAKPCETHRCLLPGSFLEAKDIVWECLMRDYAWLDVSLLIVWFERYGLLVHDLLKSCHAMQDLGECLAPFIYEVEIRYLIRFEWAKYPEDLMRRRTKWAFLNAIKPDVLVKYF